MIFKFNHKNAKAVIELARKTNSDIMLVKDESLYLMAHDLQEVGVVSAICYAEGFGPSDKPDTHCRLNDIFGDGSDECFYFTCFDNATFDSVIEKKCDLRLAVSRSEQGQVRFKSLIYLDD